VTALSTGEPVAAAKEISERSTRYSRSNSDGRRGGANVRMARSKIGVLAFVAPLVAGCNETKTPPRPPLLVRAQAVALRDYVTTLTLTGEIQARAQSDLSFRISGRVIARFADVGQHVAAGELLAKVDPAEAQADLDAANASVASAEALLKQTSAAFDRQKSLLDSGFGTRTNFDTAQQNIKTAESALDQAKAQAASATDALSYTELRAEVPGIITARDIEVGQVAQVAQAAFTLARDGPRDAVFNVFESAFFLKPAGNSVPLTLIADPGVHAIGHVREVAPAVDAKSGTVRVKVGIDDTQPSMPLGASVKGTGAFEPSRVFILPWSAATTAGGNLAVWIVDPATKTVSLREVGAEAYAKDELVIRDGLKPGETVVTEGGKFLYPGQTVDIAEAKP
jgi:membrane fusion protein, multidrug efflux system